MRYYHRHSFFPLVIILLTVLLGLFILLTVSRERASLSSVQETIVPVDADLYHTQLVTLLTRFETEVSLASDDLAKLVIAERALADLLALRVPLDGKELHLELALLFTKIQTALKSEDRSVDTLLSEIHAIKEAL